MRRISERIVVHGADHLSRLLFTRDTVDEPAPEFEPSSFKRADFADTEPLDLLPAAEGSDAV